MKKKSTQRSLKFICSLLIMQVFTFACAFTQTLSYYQCAGVDGNNPAAYQLQVRMLGLHAAIKADNTSGTTAKTYTVTVKNIDPDFVILSEGTTTAKGTNSLTFTWTVAAGATQWVWINPWYLTPNNFYFLAYADNQHHPERFARALTKAALINPVMAVGAGDCIKHGDDGGCVGCGNQPQPATDTMYKSLLALFNNYPSPVFMALGNHDITRGGWATQSDANYGAGERLWRKYLGATDYSFTVHPTDPSGGIHFLISRFYYDMPNWNSRKYFGGCTPDGFLRFDNDDSVGVAISNFMQNDLAASQTAATRISVTHHGFNMFIGDHNTVANARSIYQTGKVNYMVVGHQHIYATGTDATTKIPYLITGDANGDANSGNPGFSLVRVNNGVITQQHMLADNLNLAINYTANAPTLSRGKATITCSGYSLPFVRLKFKLSNAHAAYQAKDVATGIAIPTYSHQFADYTVVYVETAINNGATKNIQVDAVSAAKVQTNSNSNAIAVTPNAARDFVTIHLPVANKPYQIVLYDMQGKPVKEIKTASTTAVINFDGLAHGAYLAKIYAGSKYVTTKRIIVAE